MRAARLVWFLPVALLAALWFAARAPRARDVPAAAGAAEEHGGAPAPELEPAPLALESAPSAREEADLPAPGARPGAEPAALTAAPLRGLVVDVATGEPVGLLRLVAGHIDTPVDAAGRFAADRALADDVEELEFHDPVHGSHVRSVQRDALVPDPDVGWIASIRVGPTYRLSVPEAREPDLAGWRACLIEFPEDGSEAISGSWAPLHAGEPPFLRYDNPWKPNRARSTFRVSLSNADGTRSGTSAALDSAIGIYPEVVVVHADQQLASVRGRLVDAEGRGKRGFVQAVPLGEPPSRHAFPAEETGDDGAFAFLGLAPGPYRFLARSRRGEPTQEKRVDVPPGATTLADFVVPVQVGVGMIQGRLVSASGHGLETQELVRLRALGGGLEMLDTSSSGDVFISGGHILRPGGDGSAGDAHVFEFNEVPAGRFELSVVPRDGWLWDPPTLVVEAPSDAAVFTRRDDLARSELFLAALDAASGEPLPFAVAQLQLGGAWDESARLLDPKSDGPLATLSAGAPLRWSVSAPGYRPVRGTEADLEKTARGLEGRIRLDRGWGVRLVLRDYGQGFLHDDAEGLVTALQHAPIANAVILANGRKVATTGADGVADVLLDKKPGGLEIQAAGWHVLRSSGFDGKRLTADVPEVLVWMVAE